MVIESVSPIGIVVPTLGERAVMLRECLVSVKSRPNTYVVLVSPTRPTESAIPSSLYDSWIEDPREGLSAAINLGISSLPKEVKYVNWLGDDDLIEPGSLDMLSNFLNENQSVGFVYGICKYINSDGSIFWTNKFGQFAVQLLRFGPNKIPQPGSLFRRKLFEEVGGLDTDLKFAMDLDLFLRFSKVSKLRYLPKVVASYRWHNDSLSSSSRANAVIEASNVRLSHIPKAIRPLFSVTERVQQFMALSGAGYLNRKSN